MRLRYIVTVLCSFLMFGAGVFFVAYSLALPAEAALSDSSAEESSAQAVFVFEAEGGEDVILAAYADSLNRGQVIEFFSNLTGSEEIAAVVLSNAAGFEIAPALAFALCWEESRYNTMAFNRNQNETVDRGLFQLNSATFPELSIEDFYDPEINAKRGLAHLLWCLNTAGTEVAGLAMYNAGTTRVRSAGTPKNTLDYISRILKNQRKIEEQFAAGCTRIILAESAEEEETAAKTPFRLSLLSPLGR